MSTLFLILIFIRSTFSSIIQNTIFGYYSYPSCLPIKFSREVIGKKYHPIIDPCAISIFENAEYFYSKRIQCGYLIEKDGIYSGIMVSNIDLSRITEEILKKADVSNDIIDKLSPFLGLSGKKAFEKLNNSQLILSIDEEDQLYNKFLFYSWKTVEEIYNKSIKNCLLCANKLEDTNIYFKTAILSNYYRLIKDFNIDEFNNDKNLDDREKNLKDSRMLINDNQKIISFIIDASKEENTRTQIKNFINLYSAMSYSDNTMFKLLFYSNNYTYNIVVNNTNYSDYIKEIDSIPVKPASETFNITIIDQVIKSIPTNTSHLMIWYPNNINLTTINDQFITAELYNTLLIPVIDDQNLYKIVNSDNRYNLEKLKCIVNNFPFNEYSSPEVYLKNDERKIDYLDIANGEVTYLATKLLDNYNLKITIELEEKVLPDEQFKITLSSLLPEYNNDRIFQTNENFEKIVSIFYSYHFPYNITQNDLVRIKLNGKGFKYSIIVENCEYDKCNENEFQLYVNIFPKYAIIIIIVVGIFILVLILIIVFLCKCQSKKESNNMNTEKLVMSEPKKLETSFKETESNGKDDIKYDIKDERRNHVMDDCDIINPENINVRIRK